MTRGSKRDTRTIPGEGDTLYLSAERSTDREISESTKLMKSHPLTTAVLETMPGGAVVLDCNRQIVAISQMLCSLLGVAKPEDAYGLRPGELLGCRVSDGAPSRCGTGEACRYCGLVNTVVECIKCDETKQGECRISLKDGGAWDLAVGATAQSVSGQLFIFVGIHDISGQKRREALESTFFHDVLNTAGGVLGLLECVKNEPQAGEHSELLSQSYALASQMVDEIRAHRQLLAAENGDLPRDRKQENVKDIMGGIVSLYSHHEVAHQRTLETGNVCDASITTDKTLLMRVLGNMVKNALEATPAGGQVVISAGAEAQSIVFRVSNPGVMPRDVQLQLFQRSFSTKGASRGIGTYSMKLLGEGQLGGKIDFSSEPESGTVFTFRVPARSPGTSVSSIEAGRPITAAEADGPTFEVLVADDNRVNQLIAGRLIKKLGWQPVVVDDGAAAVERLRHESFDAILMDVNMPGMNGLDAARAIRRLESSAKDVPIVALTAGISTLERHGCTDAGMDAFMCKPLSVVELQDTLTRVISDASAA